MSERTYSYEELLRHPSLKRVEGFYKRTRWPGIFSYHGKNGIKFGIDYYANGKKRREMIGSLQEAREKLRETHSQIQKGDFVIDRKKYSFDQLVEKYTEIFKDESYFRNSKRYYLKILQGFFGNVKLYLITPFDLERYRKVRKETPTQHGRERSGVSVNRELAVLRHMLGKACEWQMLQVNPFDRFRDKGSVFFPESPGRLRFLNEDEIQGLLNACPGYLKDIVKAGLLTGLRKSDLLSLKWEDINLEAGTITYSERKKGNRKVTKALCSDMINLLMQISKREDDYIFHGPNGEAPLKDVSRSFKTALRKAGILDFTFHGLRHTFASHLAMRGVSMKVIQAELAHSSISMTERYSHLSSEHQKLEVERLNGLCDERPDSKKIVRSDQNAEAIVSERGYANA